MASLTPSERLRAYLAEMDRIDGTRRQYADEVHGINDLPLRRSDIAAVLAERDAALAALAEKGQ